MEKHYKDLLDQLDNLMIALCKQKKIGLDGAVMVALSDLTKSRNAFKREFVRAYVRPAHITPVLCPKETVFTHVLDLVANNTMRGG